MPLPKVRIFTGAIVAVRAVVNESGLRVQLRREQFKRVDRRAADLDGETDWLNARAMDCDDINVFLESKGSAT
jgi:hypothetical protein